MKKVLMFCAMITGAFSVMIGTTSCSGDPECCTWTDDFGDSYSYCEDDNLPPGGTWELVKEAVDRYNGTCN